MAKESLKLIAYNTIREKIIKCEYAPGDMLNEDAIRESLGISRTPIRDALSRLEQEGLINIKAKQGIQITPLSVGDINKVFEVRLLYEPYILLNYGQLIPQERLEHFYNLFLETSQHEGHIPHEKKDEFYQLDSDFHFLIVTSCSNQYFLQSYNIIMAQDARFRHLTGNCSTSRILATSREHLDILRHTLQNDWKAASESMAEHILQSKKATFDLILSSEKLNQMYL